MKKEKKNKKSLLQGQFDKAIDKLKKTNETPESQKAFSLNRLEQTFVELGNRENRYLFYCPDMPFASTLGKTVYEFAYHLQEQGFNTTVLHEETGYKPSWFGDQEWVAKVKVDYIVNKKRSADRKSPNYKFKPTDTIILPEGFWSLAEGFKDIRPIQKVILALGYGGVITADPGMDWSHFGFTDVICLSEKLKEDYSTLWPHFRYHVVNYTIDCEQFAPVDKTEVYPAIALATRSREDAQAIINVFYNKYSFLDMFQFKVLKKLETETYADTLKHCCCLIFVDEKSGHPAPPLEAIACGTPVIAVYGRGMSHLEQQEGITWLEANDSFLIAETIAQFCLNWLQSSNVEIKDKTVLENYTVKVVKEKLYSIFRELQDEKTKTFAAIKQAIEADTLNYVFDENESASKESTLAVVK